MKKIISFLKGSTLLLVGIFALYGGAKVAENTGHAQTAVFLEQQGAKIAQAYQEQKVVSSTEVAE